MKCYLPAGLGCASVTLPAPTPLPTEAVQNTLLCAALSHAGAALPTAQPALLRGVQHRSRKPSSVRVLLWPHPEKFHGKLTSRRLHEQIGIKEAIRAAGAAKSTRVNVGLCQTGSDKQPQTHLRCAEMRRGAPLQNCWSLRGQRGALGRPPAGTEPACFLRMTFFLRNTRQTAHHSRGWIRSSVTKPVMLGCVHTDCELWENRTFLPKSCMEI